MSTGDDYHVSSAQDMMRGAWIIQTLVLALVLLLVARSAGYAITLVAFLGSLMLAGLIMLGVYAIRKHRGIRD